MFVEGSSIVNSNSGSAQAIKEAFRALLRTTPYDAITVNDISAAAFVSKKTFYKYFESKQYAVHAIYRTTRLRSYRSCWKKTTPPSMLIAISI